MAHVVHDVDIGVVHLAEILLADIGVIDGDGEGDLLHGGGNQREVHFNDLVVAVALAGEVVARVDHAAGSVLEVAIEHKVSVAGHLAVSTHQACRGVQIKVCAAVIAVGVPAQADHQLAQTGIALC